MTTAALTEILSDVEALGVDPDWTQHMRKEVDRLQFEHRA